MGYLLATVGILLFIFFVILMLRNAGAMAQMGGDTADEPSPEKEQMDEPQEEFISDQARESRVDERE